MEPALLQSAPGTDMPQVTDLIKFVAIGRLRKNSPQTQVGGLKTKVQTQGLQGSRGAANSPPI